MPGHEIDRLVSDLLGGNDQITLVLAAFIIHHDDQLAPPHGGKHVLDGIQHCGPGF